MFVDSDRATWNMDPGLLTDELQACARRKKLPKAVVAVDLYGQCADYEPIVAACARYGVPLIEDAAEALGATYNGRSAGTFGAIGVFSFNGNKIITTSSGGMLVCDDRETARRARFLAAQARDPAPHYQHSEIGYNYRMSNLLAAVGRGQLRALAERVEQRRANFLLYRHALSDLPGIAFMPEPRRCRSTRWLTCITVDPDAFGAAREDIRLALEAENIEARPTWKPMHLQPAFAACRVRGGAVAEHIFEQGLCLPSGSNLAEEDLLRVVNLVRHRRRLPSVHARHSAAAADGGIAVAATLDAAIAWVAWPDSAMRPSQEFSCQCATRSIMRIERGLQGAGGIVVLTSVGLGLYPVNESPMPIHGQDA